MPGHYIRAAVASQKSKRRSRKRRDTGTAPRAVRTPRREQRAERRTIAETERRRHTRTAGPAGERPPSPVGGLPISELAIFLGIVALIVWFINGGTVTLVVGLGVCALGVLEVTAREHFTGYRSHAQLLAAIPAIGLAIGFVSLIGEQRNRGLLLVLIAGPVFAILFWLLRKRFRAARQARLARPPAA